MGRKVLAFCFLFLFFTFAFYANAQEDSATPGGRILLQETIQDRMEAAQNRREQIQEEMRAKREKFREHIQTIRDEVKRRVVERIDARIGVANQRTTNRFMTVLDKLQSILNRLKGGAEDAKLAGRDIEAINDTIGIAQVAIDNAKTAVASQTANIYVIEIASESALRNDVGKTVSQLRTDLASVHKMVIDAKQAVQNVVMEYAKLRGGGLGAESTATSSSE